MTYKHIFARDFEKNINSIVRVNYAGEMAAVVIYKTQKEIFPNDEHIPQMLECEMKHFEYFKNLTSELKIEKTIFLPIWKRFAKALAYVSAKNSYFDAMLLTHAVEDVIEKHYAKQIVELGGIVEYYNCEDLYIKNNYEILQKLLAEIKIFMADEVEHKHTGIENSKMKVVKYTLAKFMTGLAVELSEKY